MLADQKAAQEIADRGEKIYVNHIKPLTNFEEDKGKFVIIDVESGDYEIDKRDAMASHRLLERRPNGVLYGLRIGFPAAYRLSGISRIRNNDYGKS